MKKQRTRRFTFQELLEKCLPFEPSGVANPEDHDWIQHEGDSSGTFYPDISEDTHKPTSKPTKPSYSLFSGNTETLPEPSVDSSGDMIQISKEQYEFLLKASEEATLRRTIMVLNEELQRLRKTPTDLVKKISDEIFHVVSAIQEHL